jgi:hypothetical protein
MIPRYRANGVMVQDAAGTYVAAADYERLAAELNELGDQVAAYWKAVERGEMSAQEAIAAAAVCARFKGAAE